MGDRKALESITKRNIEAALRRTGPSRRIDLVHDIASVAVYGVISELFGTPGPTSLTELAVALPFARQHVGDLEPEWLLAASARKPDDPGLATWQIWSILLFADIVGNATRQPELMSLANQAGSEFLNHLGALIVRARASSSMTPEKSTPPNLLAAFVSLEKTFVGKCGYTSVDYYSDVRILLLELVSSAVVIPSTFGSVMATLLDFGINLSELMPVLLADPQFGMAAADATAQKGAEATDRQWNAGGQGPRSRRDECPWRSTQAAFGKALASQTSSPRRHPSWAPGAGAARGAAAGGLTRGRPSPSQAKTTGSCRKARAAESLASSNPISRWVALFCDIGLIEARLCLPPRTSSR